MKVGLCFSPIYPPATAEYGIQLAEQIQADSAWIVDHLMGSFHPALWGETGWGETGVDPDAYMDPFCLLAALGQKTSIPLGIGVTDSMRRGSADLARSMLTLQHLCKGGFKLGIGSGEAANLLPFGYSFDKPVARCEEVLAELRQLLDTGTFPGGSGHGRTAIPRESGAGKAEVWVAGHGPRMLRLTGQYGDGWYPAWAMTPEEYGEKRRTIAEHADKAGRPAPESGLQPFMILAESLDRLEEQFDAQPAGKLFTLFFPGELWVKHGVDHPLGNDTRGFIDVIVHELDGEELRELAPKIPFSMLKEAFFIGSAEDLVEQIEPYARQGLEHVFLANMTGIVGGMEEIMARGPDFVRLASLLREL